MFYLFKMEEDQWLFPAGKASKLSLWCGGGLQHAREEGKVVDILDLNTDTYLCKCIAVHKINKLCVA